MWSFLVILLSLLIGLSSTICGSTTSGASVQSAKNKKKPPGSKGSIKKAGKEGGSSVTDVEKGLPAEKTKTPKKEDEGESEPEEVVEERPLPNLLDKLEAELAKGEQDDGDESDGSEGEDDNERDADDVQPPDEKYSALKDPKNKHNPDFMKGARIRSSSTCIINQTGCVTQDTDAGLEAKRRHLKMNAMQFHPDFELQKEEITNKKHEKFFKKVGKIKHTAPKETPMTEEEQKKLREELEEKYKNKHVGYITACPVYVVYGLDLCRGNVDFDEDTVDERSYKEKSKEEKMKERKMGKKKADGEKDDEEEEDDGVEGKDGDGSDLDGEESDEGDEDDE